MLITLKYNDKKEVVSDGKLEDALHLIKVLENFDPESYDLQFERSDKGFLQFFTENDATNIAFATRVNDNKLLCKYHCNDEAIPFDEMEEIISDFFKGRTSFPHIEWDDSMDDYIDINTPSKSKQGCYIATAVYGSYDCPQVWVLRRFRDKTLASTWYGRTFIYVYYTISPTLVKYFGHTKWFQKMWRNSLDKLILKLENNGIESSPYCDEKW